MKKFIVTGVQMRNKGSQAMFLSLCYGLKSIYPGCEVVGFANKYDDPAQYQFELLPYDDFTRLVFKYRLNRVPWLGDVLAMVAGMWRKTGKWSGKITEMDSALRDADAIFDASGYTLGSGWGKGGGRLLLQTIRIAREYKKQIILMPQSFGPFDWGEDDDAAFLEEVREELDYCTRIYAREREGYGCLRSLGLGNVELSADMVIREKVFPQARDILSSYDAATVSFPPSGSVGFIINENVFRIGKPEAVLDLYSRMLDRLITAGERVFILNTSTADFRLVESVLGKTENRDKVGLISGEYSSPELIDIIGRFKYVVASRYHSVVFAYRSGVPAIILGWASKYIDLAAHFQQDEYVFDIRDPDAGRIIEQVDRMSVNYAAESRQILACLEEIQRTSVIGEAASLLRSAPSL